MNHDQLSQISLPASRPTLLSVLLLSSNQQHQHTRLDITLPSSSRRRLLSIPSITDRPTDRPSSTLVFPQAVLSFSCRSTTGGLGRTPSPSAYTAEVQARVWLCLLSISWDQSAEHLKEGSKRPFRLPPSVVSQAGRQSSHRRPSWLPPSLFLPAGILVIIHYYLSRSFLPCWLLSLTLSDGDEHRKGRPGRSRRTTTIQSRSRGSDLQEGLRERTSMRGREVVEWATVIKRSRGRALRPGTVGRSSADAQVVPGKRTFDSTIHSRFPCYVTLSPQITAFELMRMLSTVI
jgi:hypothetical protein